MQKMLLVQWSTFSQPCLKTTEPLEDASFVLSHDNITCDNQAFFIFFNFDL